MGLFDDCVYWYDYPLVIGLIIGVSILSLALRLAAGIGLAVLSVWACGVLNVGIDDTLVSAIIIGLSVASFFFSSSKHKD